MQRLASCLFVVVVACGGGGGDSAEDKCVDLVSTMCDRVVDCGVLSSHDDCMEAFEDDIDCSKAKSVNDNYDECIGDIEDASCGELFQTIGGQPQFIVPQSCENTFE